MRSLLVTAAAVALGACATPVAQLKADLGVRVSKMLVCPQDQLKYEELERVISTTKLKVSGCGKDSYWRLESSRWVPSEAEKDPLDQVRRGL